ncbi:MAG TPA: hypothetical protein VNN21_04340 [Dehalococcoidia bacterium]|nr:hypothetical protein [Dehalococcoidia bacterium]
MKRLGWLLLPLAATALALAFACGGDKDKGANSTSSGEGASTGGSGSASARELNINEAFTALQDLRSFRFDLAMKMDFGDALAGLQNDETGLAAAFLALFSDIKMEGAYVAPDSFDINMRLAGRDMRIVQIGREAWINDGSGWTAADASGALDLFSGAPTDLASELLPAEVLKVAKTSSETVNGVKATKYSFDKQSLKDVAERLGQDTGSFDQVDDMQLNLWMTEDNLPVKFALTAKGTDEAGNKISISMEMNIRDLNSDSIRITKPV